MQLPRRSPDRLLEAHRCSCRDALRIVSGPTRAAFRSGRKGELGRNSSLAQFRLLGYARSRKKQPGLRSQALRFFAGKGSVS